MDTLRRSPLAGPLWETLVVGQVTRHFQVERRRPPLWFWQTAQGDEVDLIVDRGGRFLAIECKRSEHPGSESLRGLHALARMYGGDAVEEGFIASRAPRSYRIQSEPVVRAVGLDELIVRLASG